MTNTNQYELPIEKVSLPSRGILYDKQLAIHSGYIELAYPTAKNQDILTSATLVKKGVMIDQFIKSLILTPKVKLDQLLTFDRDKLVFVSRAMAYTSQYKTKIICPKCEKQNDVTINLNQLDEIFLGQGITQNKIQVILPLAKKSVTFKFLTVREQEQVNAEIKSLQRLRRSIDGATPQITTRLKKMIVSIDGNQDKMFISQYVDKYLLSNDSLFLRREIKKNTPGIVNKFKFNCKHCQFEKELAVPLTAQFFYPELAQ